MATANAAVNMGMPAESRLRDTRYLVGFLLQ